MTFHILWDTETTDVWRNTVRSLDKQPYIFEFYGMKVDMSTFEIVDELTVYAKPQGKISKDASRVTGKKDEDFANFPSFSENALRIKEFMEGADASVAHNLRFDVKMLDFEFARLGMAIDWPRLICTVERTEWIQGYRLSLTALHELLFGEGFTGAHEAKTDVDALYRCYVELTKRKWI